MTGNCLQQAVDGQLGAMIAPLRGSVTRDSNGVK
jgi:hypothetical protein